MTACCAAVLSPSTNNRWGTDLAQAAVGHYFPRIIRFCCEGLAGSEGALRSFRVQCSMKSFLGRMCEIMGGPFRRFAAFGKS